jgi:hypothetical protein
MLNYFERLLLIAEVDELLNALFSCDLQACFGDAKCQSFVKYCGWRYNCRLLRNAARVSNSQAQSDSCEASQLRSLFTVRARKKGEQNVSTGS